MNRKALALQGMSDGHQALYDSAMEVPVDTVADMFAMSRAQLAQTVGLSPEVLQKTRLRTARKTQARLREMLEIITRVTDWAGGRMQAMAWYRAQPIPAFGGRTAEAMVKTGNAAAVRDYLDHMALGGYA
ncbi:MAG: antitoxin Xre/MbcA/ParS toxin-binding domain-containing protein [Sphingomonadales bacterium]